VLPTDLTVSVVVENDGKFLIIEERVAGVIVVNQPGGHIDAGEFPEQAAERETLEEAGCRISVTGLLGVYLWIHPQTRQNHLRIVYVADLLSQDRKRVLDDGIHAVHWFTISDLKRRLRDLRTPVVLRSVEDYLSGKRQPDTLLAGIMPIQQNVDQVLARASLV
jgi:8-oxo-dGTP pyrophosphatase MutT (NUDIX family)